MTKLGHDALANISTSKENSRLNVVHRGLKKVYGTYVHRRSRYTSAMIDLQVPHVFPVRLTLNMRVSGRHALGSDKHELLIGRISETSVFRPRNCHR